MNTTLLDIPQERHLELLIDAQQIVSRRADDISDNLPELYTAIINAETDIEAFNSAKATYEAAKTSGQEACSASNALLNIIREMRSN